MQERTNKASRLRESIRARCPVVFLHAHESGTARIELRYRDTLRSPPGPCNWIGRVLAWNFEIGPCMRASKVQSRNSRQELDRSSSCLEFRDWTLDARMLRFSRHRGNQFMPRRMTVSARPRNKTRFKRRHEQF